MTDAGSDGTPSVGTQVRRGAVWSLLNNVVIRLGSLISGIVLARILSPADYGVYAIALVALTLLYSLNELGTSLAIVRWEGDVRVFAPTVMTVALITSTLLYTGIFLVAPAFCELMGSPQATGVVRLMCVCLLIDAIAVVPIGILNREFMQRQRFMGDLVSFATSTATTITLAAVGVGPASFAWGRIAGGILATTAFTLLAPIRIRPGWSREQARKLIRFGIPLTGTSLLVLSVSNVDQLLVGAQLDEVALGLYLMASNQSSWPLTVFSEAARRVSFAGFSRLSSDPPALARSLARGFGLLMALTIPVCVLLAAYAEPMLTVVYGARWAPAAHALGLLAFVGLIRVALFVCYDLLIALDRSRLLIGLQGLWLAMLIPAVIVGTHLDGIRGAAAGHLIVATVIVGPAFTFALRKLHMHPARLFLATVRPAIGGLLIAGSAFVVWSVFDTALARLLVGGAVGLALYAPVVLPMRHLLPGRGGSRPAPDEDDGSEQPDPAPDDTSKDLT